MSGDQWIFPLHTLWAHELRALLGPSQRALECTMEHKTAESVALATFLPRKLLFSTGNLDQSEQVAATALWPACGLA